MLLFLIGLPGSGKTTLGKQIASLLNFQFVDLDQEIVRIYGSTIESIFAEKGEAAFREMERDTLRSLSNKTNLVVATGGGAPCFHENMEWMNNNGITLFLNPPLDELASRLSVAKNSHRPMLKNFTQADTLLFLKQKQNERETFYNQAAIIIQKTSPTAEDIKYHLRKEGLIA